MTGGGGDSHDRNSVLRRNLILERRRAGTDETCSYRFRYRFEFYFIDSGEDLSIVVSKNV